ncbi:MAG TPA: PilX N-terminal domain-containing pilus assembly protein [Steroidobacteraceae bacterium]|jgi:Tfp pilus assembly protein PilX|nr:PilX N-terminal domain-containing pilus assembly protein [Steroidobacteraceae bacterium]
MVLFISLILLLVLTVLGVSLARLQTLNERLAQNDVNQQLALETAAAALQAAYDDDADGKYSDFSGGTTGLAALASEVGPAGSPATDLAYHANWASPGTDTIVYTNNGAPLAAPAAARPQFVVEQLPPQPPPGCLAGNIGYSQVPMFTHRITAHAQGGDGTASATVQIIHYGGC